VATASSFALLRAATSETQSKGLFDDAYEYSCSRYFELRRRRTGASLPSIPAKLRIRSPEKAEA
jgi:hypothetical protein